MLAAEAEPREGGLDGQLHDAGDLADQLALADEEEDDDDDDAAVDSINVTPLVDVLMVVLVMFILTATAQVSVAVGGPGSSD